MKLTRKLEHYLQMPLLHWPLIVLIAAATPLTFAPYYHFWLMPLLFAALIRLIELRPQRAVPTAYLFGLVAYTCQFYWVHTALHEVSGLPNLYALPMTLLLPAFLALYPALCFWLWKKFHHARWLKTGLILPILWTLTEYLRETLFTGFGWGALGYSQITKSSPLSGFAPVGGIHLVTLATAFIGAWLALLINNPGRLKNRVMPLCFSLAVVTAGYIFQETDFTREDGTTSTVALVQGNIAQTLKWEEEQVIPTIQKYYEHVSKTRADIVILPETALPVMRQNLPNGILSQFAEQAQSNGSALALGISQYTEDGNGYENAVVNLYRYHGEATPPYYAKNHLVPFGEYKPLSAVTAPLYKLMNMPLSDFKSGGKNQTPLHMKGQKVAFNICYEDGFGDELIATARQSTLLANVSNMAWYGDSNAMFQQLQQSQARAMELGRYMVRATNTGATAIISPKGNIIAAAEPNTETVLEGHIKGYTGETPYMKMGGSNWLAGSLAVLAVLLFVCRRRIHEAD
ncbi:apolipoprotein N-acyltransferase [Neisseria animalis]|uniref:Apolipoprotein N-acyltransferase n=1 Tax=Neisseria animalis TaxID=492 RepID=A0A5P3MPC6_NEIAN|nr:apolipoprotein N-acyltransferase [Neisseria animalis]QEY23386.1 apolipoprotein N-acyltransferase [Neisseria animalis]ROW33232.1 apolipoprotein N-acyltransferase [Neisseria animalis]VEE08824.1 apolipoprotein N-acyltransferase [Neisseria animalis]